MYEQGSWCCLTSTTGVHSQLCCILTDSPSHSEVDGFHSQSMLSGIVDITTASDRPETRKLAILFTAFYP